MGGMLLTMVVINNVINNVITLNMPSARVAANST